MFKIKYLLSSRAFKKKPFIIIFRSIILILSIIFRYKLKYKVEFGDNKFITNFSYVTENHELGNSESIKNNTLINFTDEHSLQFETTKDLKSDFTEVIKFNYGYNTDCLSISLNYNKKFFRDGNLVPNESLNFLIKFIPFAEIRGSANTILKEKEN